LQHPQRSLKYEYELYVEQEIENYKDSIPRSAILRIGDEAVQSLQSQEQLGLDELLLWAEVDRIIRKRLRIPTYATWRRRRLRLLTEYRRPEHWGFSVDALLVRAIDYAPEAHVLVADARQEGTAIYLAANGCQVTSVEEDPDVVEKVFNTAGQAGLMSRVSGCVSGLEGWQPEGPLHAVICSPAALERLSKDERERVIDLLQSATLDGGVHLVQTLVAGQSALSLEELRSRYLGWDISIIRDGRAAPSFLARKHVA
jgi:hypothetical protein